MKPAHIEIESIAFRYAGSEGLTVGIEEETMNLSIVGNGYVGLVTAIGLAMNG